MNRDIQQPKKILVVEDEDDHFELILRGFEREPREFAIERARTIGEATASMDAMLPSLVITDWKLPDGEGICLIRRDRAGRTLCPVIVMTSFGNEAWAVEAMKLGAMDYVVKSPDIFSYFQRMAKRAISEWENIGERVKAEEALRQSEEQLMKIFNSMPVLMFISTPGDGGITQVNETFLRVLGYSRHEVLGKTAGDLGLFEDRDQHASVLRQISGMGRTNDREMRIRKKNGEVLDTLYSAETIEIQRNRQLLSVFNDVSEWRKASEEKTRLQEQLRQSQKMEAIGTLAGGIAHDFNNILSVIMGYGSLLEMKLDPSSQLREHVSQILSSAQKAAHLTNQILAFSRKQVMEPRETDLGELISGIEKMLRRLMGESIELITTMPRAPLPALVDRGQIEQVLMNLCTNARDAMPSGGTLTISTEIIETDSTFARLNELEKPGPYAVISVSDTGTGMDPGTREKIFEPFFTTKEPGKGTGLGLSIAYGIVKQHKGCIFAESREGKGTIFTICLPLIDRTERRAEENEESTPLHGSETILIAEDNDGVRRLTSQVMREFGYRVIEAINGEDAVEKFREHRDRIDLVLLDAVMPKKSGREARDEIMTMRPGMNFLFMSGYSADTLESRGGMGDGSHFLPKPATTHDILARIRSILDGR